jgi:tRNA pseudouridine38-40 synthase
MVRALVGASLAVGEGRRSVDWPAELLVGGRRDPGSAVVAAHGLTLEEVVYPPDAELAERQLRTRAMRSADDVHAAPTRAPGPAAPGPAAPAPAGSPTVPGPAAPATDPARG